MFFSLCETLSFTTFFECNSTARGLLYSIHILLELTLKGIVKIGSLPLLVKIMPRHIGEPFVTTANGTDSSLA